MRLGQTKKQTFLFASLFNYYLGNIGVGSDKKGSKLTFLSLPFTIFTER